MKKPISTIVYEHYTDLIVADLIEIQSYRFYTSETLGTASWFYDNPYNIITIGERNRVNAIDYEEAIKYLFYHEISHSIWTTKEHKKLLELLKTDSIPFSIFNLFEDARIEELARQKLNIDFNWQALHQINTQEVVSSPINMFYYLIYTNGDIQKLNSIPLKSISDPYYEVRKRVVEFYQESILVKSSFDLIPIVLRWMEFTAEDSKDDEDNDKSLYSIYILSNDEDSIMQEYLGHGLEGIKNRYNLEEMIFGSPNENQEIYSIEEYKELFSTITYNYDSYDTDIDECELLYHKEIDIEYVDKNKEQILEQFDDLFVKDIIKYNLPSTIPSKRVNIKRYVLNHPKFYNQSTTTPEVENLNFTMVIDMSGSMYYNVTKSNLFFHIINTLSRLKYIDATFILSAVNQDKHCNQVINLPVDDSVINRVIARFEGEGLTSAMQENLSILQNSDYIWVYSDGNTKDVPMDKKLFSSISTKTTGIYLGDSADIEEWGEYFDNIIVEPTLEKIAKKFRDLVKI